LPTKSSENDLFFMGGHNKKGINEMGKREID
jgi:hypothetical protein